jgi:hypothetical protein
LKCINKYVRGTRFYTIKYEDIRIN